MWKWAAKNWDSLVVAWNKNHLDWRSWSGIETTWMLYDLYESLIPDAQKRKFYLEVQDWSALIAYDNRNLDEGTMATGGGR